MPGSQARGDGANVSKETAKGAPRAAQDRPAGTTGRRFGVIKPIQISSPAPSTLQRGCGPGEKPRLRFSHV